MKKNILVVQLDGCPAYRLGCYGGRPGVSPNIDALTQDAAVFQNSYATSNCTIPSVISLMTGVYPFAHKAANTISYYDGAYGSLSENMRQAGYETFCCYTNITTLSPRFGFIRGYDTFYRIGKTDNWFKASKEEGLKLKKKSFSKFIFQEYLHLFKEASFKKYVKTFARENLAFYQGNDMGGAKIVKAFKSFLASHDGEKPFFGHVNIPDTHHPYLAPKRFMEKFGQQKPTDNAIYFTLAPSDFLKRGMVLSDEDRACLDAMFDACVAYVDDLFAEMVRDLKEKGLFDNTLIVLFSDHGGNIGGKRMYMGSTCFTYEEEVKVPLILINSSAQGSFSRLASLVDVYPTLMSEAQLEYDPTAIHGENLLGRDEGREAVLCGYPHRPAWMNKMAADFPLDIILYTHTNRTMIKRDGSKLIWLSSGLHEQYDIHDDPGEERNLFDPASARSRALLTELTACFQGMDPELGHMLEYYPFNDCGEYCLEKGGFSNLPPLEVINPEAASMRIVDVND